LFQCHYKKFQKPLCGITPKYDIFLFNFQPSTFNELEQSPAEKAEIKDLTPCFFAFGGSRMVALNK